MDALQSNVDQNLSATSDLIKENLFAALGSANTTGTEYVLKPMQSEIFLNIIGLVAPDKDNKEGCSKTYT